MPNTSIMMQQASNGYRQMFEWGAGKIWEDKMIVTSNYSFPVNTDGPTVVKYIKGLEIESGCILTTAARCKGLSIFINGDLIVRGTISMTARGAYAVGQNLVIDYKNAEILANVSNYTDYEYWIAADGGAQTTRPVVKSSKNDGTVYAISGYTGNAGVNGACGGGGSGSAIATYLNYCYGGRGGNGTSFSGGSGGGGASTQNGTLYGGDASVIGGIGGAGAATSSNGSRGGSGGAGNPGGTGQAYNYISAANGQAGTGGLLTIVVNGNVIIESTGSIVSNGSNGGAIGGSYPGFGASGGGSGGGSITLLYSGTYTNNGSVQTNGGFCGFGAGAYGGNGGAGSIRVNQITI